jgi:polar amino acid transport system substrate-binding protein
MLAYSGGLDLRLAATALVVAIGLGLTAPQAAVAQTASGAATGIQIVAAARPPYMIDQDSQAAGPAVEMVLALAQATGIDPAIRLMPFQRAVIALDQGNTLYPALLRTPQRENRYTWIGEVFADRAVFFTRRGTPVVNRLEVARQFDRINVMRGSELQMMLQSFGINEIEPTNSEVDNARLLQAGRTEVWFALKAVGRATWTELGFTPAELQSGDTFATMPFWITVSNNTDPALVARLRAAYQALRRDGRYDHIVAPLRKLDSGF